MIKELFSLIWECIKSLFTFGHIKYDFINLYWYLKYGFTFGDIQDMDFYITKRISFMLEQFIIYKTGYPSNVKQEDYEKDLARLKYLSNIIYLEDEVMPYKEFEKLREEYLNLLHKYYFSFWF